MTARWYAVWLAEYPEEGCAHVRAQGLTEARRKGRARLSAEPEESIRVRRVTAVQHRAWLAADRVREEVLDA